jgi:hypothetical protein
MAVHKSDSVGTHRSLRLERLLGRQVRAANHRVIGRLEEVRVERSGPHYTVNEYVIGPAGLAERLGLGVRRLFGAAKAGYVARWDQIDLSDASDPRLTCPLEQLKRIE